MNSALFLSSASIRQKEPQYSNQKYTERIKLLVEAYLIMKNQACRELLEPSDVFKWAPLREKIVYQSDNLRPRQRQLMPGDTSPAPPTFCVCTIRCARSTAFTARDNGR